MARLAMRSGWFGFSLVGLLLVSLGLRFWGLERFNTLVFDEVYYVKFAHNYLTQTPFFDGHPPLSKYLIAIALWIGNQLPIARDSVNNLAGAPYSSWSYRWLNAVLGSLIPLVIAAIAYQLTRRRSYALIAGIFAGLDGLSLVESRYALNNVHLVLFGLVGWWFLLLALNRPRSSWRDACLAIAGIGFGASVAIKWNGLWLLLGVYGIWAAAWLAHWMEGRSDAAETTIADAETATSETSEIVSPQTIVSPLQRLTQLKLWQVGLNFAIVPFLVYRLSWIPHLQFNTGNFWQLQQQILQYHESVKSGSDVHPYCSNWYSWLVMLRPVAYFYQVARRGDPLPIAKSTVPATINALIYDVHSMGNPVLWWLSTAAIGLLLGVLAHQVWLRARGTKPLVERSAWGLSAGDRWLLLFLVVNYAANLLPWVRVTRCTFLYHYMGASVFALLAIAWLVDRWISSRYSPLRISGLVTILLVGVGFWFWLPFYLGLPVSPLEFQLRMWFRSWV